MKKHRSSKGNLCGISKEVCEDVLSEFLNIPSLGELITTSKGVYGLFNEPFKNRKNRVFKKLLQAIMDDDKQIVKEILTDMPMLLAPRESFLKNFTENFMIVSKFNHREYIPKEPLKMALERNQLNMVELILPYFNHITNGKEKALTQLNRCEVLNKVKEKKEKQYVIEINELINVIKKENFPKGNAKDPLINRISDETNKVLENFRNKVIPTKPINLGNFYDLELFLLISYEQYLKNFSTFHNANQRDLFYITVIGPLQKGQSIELIKLFCESLFEVLKQKKIIGSIAESLMLCNNKKLTAYFDENLGLYHAINILFSISPRITTSPKGTGELEAIALLLRQLYQSKTNKFSQLKNELESTNYKCLIQ